MKDVELHYIQQGTQLVHIYQLSTYETTGSLYFCTDTITRQQQRRTWAAEEHILRQSNKGYILGTNKMKKYHRTDENR